MTIFRVTDKRDGKSRDCFDRPSGNEVMRGLLKAGATESDLDLKVIESEGKAELSPKTRKPRSDKGKSHQPKAQPDKPEKKKRSRGTYFVVPKMLIRRCATREALIAYLENKATMPPPPGEGQELTVIQGREVAIEKKVQYKFSGV